LFALKELGDAVEYEAIVNDKTMLLESYSNTHFLRNTQMGSTSRHWQVFTRLEICNIEAYRAKLCNKMIHDDISKNDMHHFS